MRNRQSRVKRKDELEVAKVVMQTDVKGRRERIRLKKKRLDVIKTVGVYITIVEDGFKRRFRARIAEASVVGKRGE